MEEGIGDWRLEIEVVKRVSYGRKGSRTIWRIESQGLGSNMDKEI
jgi:hypothetical protein